LFQHVLFFGDSLSKKSVIFDCNRVRTMFLACQMGDGSKFVTV